MTNEEILSLAKQSNEKGKELENDSRLKYGTKSSYVGMILGIFMIVLRMALRREFDVGVFSIIFVIASMQAISEGKYEKKTLNWVVGSIYAIFGITGLFLYVGGLM